MKYTIEKLVQMLNLTALTYRAGIAYNYYRNEDNAFVLGGYRKINGNPPIEETIFIKEDDLKNHIIKLINFWQRQGESY